MRCLRVLLVAGLLVCLCKYACCGRILGLFHFHGKSHFIMFEALMKGLAEKGHEVVVVSHFPQESNIPNYKDLSLKGSQPDIVNNYTIEAVRNFGYVNLWKFIWQDNQEFCKVALEHPVMQNLINSNETFDVVFTEIFGVDCFMGFAHKFKIPTIAMTSSTALPWQNNRIGNPDNPSYIPNYFLPYNGTLSFQERLINTVFYLVTKLGHYYFSQLPTDTITRHYFGEDTPSLSELTRNTSLLFLNSHYSVNPVRPTVPTFVEVGGLHIGAAKKLPQAIEKFINESKDGIIFFSFGSIVRGETLPKEKIEAFRKAFQKFPQRVLWKCDCKAVANLPENVMTDKWLPQFDILSHPNVRVFISHGGLLGSQEAVYTAVPMLGIPLFADQELNIQSLVSRGVAVKVDYDNITSESIEEALKILLQDPSYKESAKVLSRLFRDRPQTAMETAIFWTEYVMRHHGAPHLQSPAVHMPLYQYLLMDVIATLLAIAAILAYAIWMLVRMMISEVFPGKKSRQIKHKEKDK